MYLGKKKLLRCKPKDVIRLANFMNLVTYKRDLEDIIDEIVEKSNVW